jgi:AAA+ superfamily predicted ATPase
MKMEDKHMDSLNLIRPYVEKEILRNARRDKITYLKVPYDLNMDKLKADIEAGARQYKGVYELLNNSPSRFILVKSHSREEGYAAITYMAGILNSRELDGDIIRENRSLDEELELDREENLRMSGDKTEGEFEEETPDWKFDYDSNINYEDPELIREEDCENAWMESNYKIPIVEMGEIRMYMSTKDSPFGMPQNNVMFGGVESEITPPYWLDGSETNICIETNSFNTFIRSDIDYMYEFKNHRHVFLLITTDNIDMCSSAFAEFDDFEGDELYPSFSAMEEFENELLLEYSSDTVTVELPSEEYNAYYKLIFNCWLKEHELTLEKGFPLDKLVNQITKINRDDKSYLIDRLLSVLKVKRKLNGVVKQEDLATFEVFRYVMKKEEKVTHSAVKRLDEELVGLEPVKQQIKSILNIMKMKKQREKKGLSVNNVHNVFLLLGAPGTAKTTVAKLMGTMMKEEKLLKGDKFISVNGTELKGMYVGHSAPKTKQIFDKNDIIFIDEAYSLAASDVGGMDIFAQEALSQLMLELEKHSQDKLIMFAGYGGNDVAASDNKMLEFLNANPGLRSRISFTLVFPSYNADEMVQIVHKQAQLMDFVLDEQSDSIIRNYFMERSRDRSFGNGREARRLIETCQYFMADRIFTKPNNRITKQQLKTICKEDVVSAIEKLRQDNKAQTGVSGVFGFEPY